MDNMEYIDDYFKSSPTDEQKSVFEQRVVNDISFAEDVAFYISANGIIQEQLLEAKKKRFKEIYAEQDVVHMTKQPVKVIWRYMAAASVVAAIFVITVFLPGKKTSPQELADQYIHQKFELSEEGTMGGSDSLQKALVLFDSKRFPEALAQLQNILKKDSTNDIAKRYAGIASLKVENYDQALAYFSSLAAQSLRSNPGKFYEAVALIKRNKSGDVNAAIKLLHDVSENKQLQENEEAAKWLKKLE